MGVGTIGLGTPITSLAPYQAPWASHLGGTGLSPFSAQIPQQSQLLQGLPQQLQQLTQLHYLQQQQLQQLLQVVQLIPAQLAQLQQTIQIIPQLLQQQAQPFGQFAGAGLTPWGLSSSVFGQPGYVM